MKVLDSTKRVLMTTIHLSLTTRRGLIDGEGINRLGLITSAFLYDTLINWLGKQQSSVQRIR